jgi:hypothetical protein
MATNGIRDKALLPPRAKTWLDTLSALEGESGISFAPNMDAVRQREADLAAYLGQTDYDKQLQESRNMAKLQLGLALAQRGFGSMGAQPRPGEMAISTVGRELLSPLSGDALTVAQQMYQQKLATQQAKRQEERQLKLAALQAVTGEEADRRSLATELMTKAGADTLNDTVHYVLRQGTDEEWEFVPQTDDGKGRLQVRLQKGTGAPYNVQTQTLRSLLGGEIIVKAADVKNYIPDFDPSGDAVKISDVGLVQRWGTDDDDKLSLEPQLYETKAVWKDGKLKQVRVDTGEDIVIGTGGGEYEVYEKPTAGDKPAGVASTVFRDRFSGFLSMLPLIQTRQNLGDVSVKFDPLLWNKNDKTLEPTENFPIVRSDGVPLTETEKRNIADNWETTYFNLTEGKSFETGEKEYNFNVAAANTLLNKGIEHYGLERPEGVVVEPIRETRPAQIRELYKISATDLRDPNKSDLVASQVLGANPVPTDNALLRSGFAKAVLLSRLSGSVVDENHPFGTHTTQRMSDGGIDAQAVQNRAYLEALAKDSRFSLTFTNYPTSDKQYTALLEEAKKRNDDLRTEWMKPNNLEHSEDVRQQVQFIEFLDQYMASAAQSGVPGFWSGPVEAFLAKVGITSPGDFFRSEEGKIAAARIISSQPYMTQFISRGLLKASGDERYSDRDLKGAQQAVGSLNEADQYTADKLLRLREQFMSSLKTTLRGLGTYAIDAQTLENAARLGIDFSDIKPSSNLYTPFTAGRYAVTGQQQPGYNSDEIQNFREEGIFRSITVPGTTRNPYYSIVETQIDPDTGISVPVLGPNNKPKKIIVSHATLFSDANKDLREWNFNELFRKIRQ